MSAPAAQAQDTGLTQTSVSSRREIAPPHTFNAHRPGPVINGSDTVTIYVGGSKFVTKVDTIISFEGTLLAESLAQLQREAKDIGDPSATSSSSLSSSSSSDECDGSAGEVKRKDRQANFVMSFDRNPAVFPIILDYMRDTKVGLPRHTTTLQTIQFEARYYGLTGLISRCQVLLDKIETLAHSTGRVVSLTREDAAIRDEENKYRTLFARGTNCSQQAEGLLVFPYQLPSKERAKLGAPRLKLDYHFLGTKETAKYPTLAETEEGLAFPSSRQLFLNKFNAFTLNILDDLEWNNIFVAGGAVLAALDPLQNIQKGSEAGKISWIEWYNNCSDDWDPEEFPTKRGLTRISP